MTNPQAIYEDWVVLTKKLRQAGISRQFDLVLKILFAAARSRRDLRHLHDEVLETDLRLSREDFLAVDSFWVKHLKPENSANAQPMAWAHAFFLLNQDMKPGTLQAYYSQRLERAAKKVYRTIEELGCSGSDSQTIYSDVERTGSGDHQYQAHVFNEVFFLACMLRPNSELRVCFQVMGNDLTEDLTHKLISQLPAFDVANYGWSTDTGENIQLVYDLDGRDLVGHLQQGPPEHKNGRLMKIGGRQFLQSLIERLVDMGVPITKIYRRL